MYEVLFNFYSVEERLPDKDGKYFTLTDDGYPMYLSYLAEDKTWNTTKTYKDSEIIVKYWSESPEMINRLREICEEQYRNESEVKKYE